MIDVKIPGWLAEFQATAPHELRVEVDAVVAATLGYMTSLANYDDALDAGEDCDQEIIRGIDHPDNACGARGAALALLEERDPATAERFRAAEEAAEQAAAAAAAARPAWLAEIYALAAAQAADDIARLLAAEKRVQAAEEAEDWGELAEAQAADTALYEEIFGEE